MIQKVFRRGKSKWGYRQVVMKTLELENTVVNHKMVRRVMKKFNLCCKIRRKKPGGVGRYHSSKSRAFSNILCRNFEVNTPDEVYSGDVTEVILRNSRRGYIHMVKDLCTSEIVSFNVSYHPDVRLVTQEFRKHLENLSDEVRAGLIYHTDQGGVFMSDSHVNMTDNLNVMQSMSRRGNCLDNAPIESFFGHMKDDVDFKDCEDLNGLRKLISNYVDYYNHQRPQWGLKKMTPAKRRSQLLS